MERVEVGWRETDQGNQKQQREPARAWGDHRITACGEQHYNGQELEKVSGEKAHSRDDAGEGDREPENPSERSHFAGDDRGKARNVEAAPVECAGRAVGERKSRAGVDTSPDPDLLPIG